MDKKKQIRVIRASKAAMSQLNNIGSCIICQKSTQEPTKNSENASMQIRHAALIWDDIVGKRLAEGYETVSVSHNEIPSWYYY